jgi:hypothetical protein
MIAHPINLPSLPPPTVLLKQDYTFRNLSWKPFIILQAILLLIFCIMKYYWSSNKFLQANNLFCLEIIINWVYSSHSSLNLTMSSHFVWPLLMAGTSAYIKHARAVAWIFSMAILFPIKRHVTMLSGQRCKKSWLKTLKSTG